MELKVGDRVRTVLPTDVSYCTVMPEDEWYDKTGTVKSLADAGWGIEYLIVLDYNKKSEVFYIQELELAKSEYKVYRRKI